MKPARPALLFSLALALLASCTSGGGSAIPADAETPLPPEFAGLTNPLPSTPETIERGHLLFEKNCAPCHGADGDGKGPASVSLTPPPANFRDGVRLSIHTDAWIFMRMTMGKKETAMPAFGPTLSEDERWAILRFLRSLPGAQQKR